VTIDRERSAARIDGDIEASRDGGHTTSERSDPPLRLYREYRNTLDYFGRELERIGFEVSEDAVGRSSPAPAAGEPAFGVGSHCDSNRNGGKYDGTNGRCHGARGLPPQ